MRTRSSMCVHGFFSSLGAHFSPVSRAMYQFSVPTSKSRSKDSGLLLDDDSTTSLATFDEKVLILSISTGSREPSWSMSHQATRLTRRYLWS